MQSSTLIIAVLATWRITSLFVYEAGPWDVFSRLRELAGLEYGARGESVSAKYKILEVLFCVWCLSLWVGGLFLLIYLVLGEGWVVAASLPFALSMGAIVVDRLTG